jgi:hypothetical protein
MKSALQGGILILVLLTLFLRRRSRSGWWSASRGVHGAASR